MLSGFRRHSLWHSEPEWLQWEVLYINPRSVILLEGPQKSDLLVIAHLKCSCEAVLKHSSVFLLLTIKVPDDGCRPLCAGRQQERASDWRRLPDDLCCFALLHHQPARPLLCFTIVPVHLTRQQPVLPSGPRQSAPRRGPPLAVSQRDREHPAAHQPALSPHQQKRLTGTASKMIYFSSFLRSSLSLQLQSHHEHFTIDFRSASIVLTSLRTSDCKKILVPLCRLCLEWPRPSSATSCRAAASGGRTSLPPLSSPTTSSNPSTAQVTCR